jgi:ABC-2 type transport system ATP-binding protein
MEHTVVDVSDLSRSFGRKTALDGVSFRATAGLVHGLVGANGAGNTTRLKHLLGLLRAATGSVRVFGLDPVRDPVGVLSRIGYLSEERDLPEWMRIDELMAQLPRLNAGNISQVRNEAQQLRNAVENRIEKFNLTGIYLAGSTGL